jgi:hypothetical protein
MALGLASLQGGQAQQGCMNATECAVTQIAEKEVAAKFPDFDMARNPPMVQDKGNQWRVDYRLPDGVLGGTPVVLIDKKTMKVVRVFHSQ